MNEFLPEIKSPTTQQGWWDIRDLTGLLGITRHAISKLLKNHADVLRPYIKHVPSRGRNGSKICLNRDGIKVLVTIKDRQRTHNGISNPRLHKESETKVAVAEQHTEMSKYMNDPVIALRVDQLRLKERVEAIELRQSQAEEHLTALPIAENKPKEKTLRAKVNERVRAYVRSTGVEYKEAWSKLYKELYYRYGFNATARAEHRQTSPIEEIEKEGYITELFEICCDILE